MCFFSLSLLLFRFVLSPLHIKCDHLNNIPFKLNYVSLWGEENMMILDQNNEVQLTFNQYSGSGFTSRQQYGSGVFSMEIKMPQKDSTAVITTFYLISDGGPTRDEIDFEFLGGNNERPYILHTNIFTNGYGNREQQIHLWFDPTLDFHNYTLLWNEKQLVFFVDEIPIRVFKNTTNKGGSYFTKAMKIDATIWTSPWGSGGIPINWNDAPFQAHYKGFGINGCQTQSISTNITQCNSSRYWWNHEKFWELNYQQIQAYKNVRDKYLIYDYCAKQPQNLECSQRSNNFHY
ncbi:unnamed protein product [Vicia faba]|uniref:Xyloglucan endotransglucosylase/hydrolase n=1 Tax=Vicia faba TaxID=3906 RepID=A0AAV1A8I4_VICFA|nr:unnamed protein product [Vicia faba]